jgi:hypothetical protein
MLIARLHSLLRDVRDAGGASFTGVGVLVSVAPHEIPIMPLRLGSAPPDEPSALDLLVSISQPTSRFHDGFHILSPDLNVSQVSMYFSPPIVPGLTADPRRLVGGRYWAARFGSALPAVLASGVASAAYGVAVFKNGREISV